jgi:hypothetical protein|tara:strand:+ start:769 stop:1269 length:501 start_codon:yes stop_codon:yes gene_type:complete
MTKSEAKDILILRVDFKLTGSSPLSGKHFEGEHPIINIENIKSSQPTSNITEGGLNNYITDLKTSVIYNVLSDAFDKDIIEDGFFTTYPAILDNAISKKMAIKVIELIISSSRINSNQRFNNESVKQIYIDLNNTNGIREEYLEECKRIKKVTGGLRRIQSKTFIA